LLVYLDHMGSFIPVLLAQQSTYSGAAKCRSLSTICEVSEGELRERAEQEEERRAEELGTENEGEEEHGLFLPTPAFMASAESE